LKGTATPKKNTLYPGFLLLRQVLVRPKKQTLRTKNRFLLSGFRRARVDSRMDSPAFSAPYTAAAAATTDRMEQGMQAMMMVHNPWHNTTAAAAAAAAPATSTYQNQPAHIPTPYIIYPTAAAAAAAAPSATKTSSITGWIRPVANAIKTTATTTTTPTEPPRIGGVDVSAHSWFLRWRFLWVTLVVFLAEAILGAWPVVALSVWGWTSLFALVHFLWWFKALLLFPAVMRNMAAPWLLASDQVKHQGQLRSSAPSLWRSFWNSAYTWDLTLWSMVSIFGHALASAIILILTLVTRSVMVSTLQWILLIVFGAVAIIESLVSPWFVMGWAIDRPALQARESSLLLLTPLVPTTASTPGTTTVGVPWSSEGRSTQFTGADATTKTDRSHRSRRTYRKSRHPRRSAKQYSSRRKSKKRRSWPSKRLHRHDRMDDDDNDDDDDDDDSRA
jgi:hypothetical protein